MRALIVAAVLGLLAVPLRSEMTLNLTLDDPQGLIKNKPGGIEKITPEFAAKGATIASGTGGRILPQINEGPKKPEPGEVKIEIVSDPGFSATPFLRASLPEKSGVRSVGIGVIPDTVASSLTGFVIYEKGLAKIDGALDLFFRITNDSGHPPDLSLWGKCGTLGFNLNLDPDSRQLVLKAFTSGKQLDLDGDGTGDKNSSTNAVRVQGVIQSGEIYHLAIVFRTSPAGVISVCALLQQGTGPLPSNELPDVALESFSLLAGDQRSVADKITFHIGQAPAPQTLDIAVFRIFKGVPEILPGIDGKTQ